MWCLQMFFLFVCFFNNLNTWDTGKTSAFFFSLTNDFKSVDQCFAFGSNSPKPDAAQFTERKQQRKQRTLAHNRGKTNKTASVWRFWLRWLQWLSPLCFLLSQQSKNPKLAHFTAVCLWCVERCLFKTSQRLQSSYLKVRRLRLTEANPSCSVSYYR